MQPGWYPDESAPLERYFDGARWTHVIPLGSPKPDVRSRRPLVDTQVWWVLGGSAVGALILVSMSWSMTIAVALTALFLGVLLARLFVSRARAVRQAQQNVIDRAEYEHAALMRGDDRIGIYGQFPPQI